VLQFRYFMLRLRITDERPGKPPTLIGVAVRHDFSSNEELVKVMETWDAGLRPPETTSGAGEREPGAALPEAGKAKS
jgi:hypothetical protein